MDNSVPAPVKPTIQKVAFTHDAIIDEIIVNPAIQQAELSRHFGYTQAWMSIIINSDAFKERLAERKAELVDPKIMATINDRLDAVAKRALDKIMDRLEDTVRPKDADLISMAKLGVGDRNNRPAGPQTQNNLYVVALPPPAANSQAWIGNLSQTPRAPMEVIQQRVEALTTRHPPGGSLIIENAPGV